MQNEKNATILHFSFLILPWKWIEDQIDNELISLK